MKILITGASGMLAQYLIEVFRGHEIIALSRAELDITDQDQIKRKIHDLQPEIILNTASYNDVDRAEREKDKANQVNGLAVGYLAQEAREIGATIIHYSTDYVFSGGNVKGYVEDDKPSPQSSYARSKFLGEECLRRQRAKFYLIRTSRLFGKLGQSQKSKKSFVDLMLDKAPKQEVIEVVNEEVSSPTYAFDLASRTREIIEWQKSYGIYHITNEGGCTWYEFAREIFKIVSQLKKGFIPPKLVPVRASHFPREAWRPVYSVLKNTKLPLMRTWQEALREYLRIRN